MAAQFNTIPYTKKYGGGGFWWCFWLHLQNFRIPFKWHRFDGHTKCSVLLLLQMPNWEQVRMIRHNNVIIKQCKVLQHINLSELNWIDSSSIQFYWRLKRNNNMVTAEWHNIWLAAELQTCWNVYARTSQPQDFIAHSNANNWGHFMECLHFLFFNEYPLSDRD